MAKILFVFSVFFLSVPAMADINCPNLSGRYKPQDPTFHKEITITQDGCKTLTISTKDGDVPYVLDNTWRKAGSDEDGNPIWEKALYSHWEFVRGRRYSSGGMNFFTYRRNDTELDIVQTTVRGDGTPDIDSVTTSKYQRVQDGI